MSRFPSLSLRDPTMLQSSGPPDQASIWGWWAADEYVTEGPNSTVTVWGDKSANTANKTALSGTRNLIPQGTRPLGISSADNKANMFAFSEELLNAAWTTLNCTINSNTLATFTAMGGVFNTFYGIYRSGINYTLAADLRRVSGNTALEWVHFGTGSNYTPVNITSSLARYSMTFNGTGANIYIGLRDNNGGGWGQVEATNWQVYETAWGSPGYVHIPTSNLFIYPKFGGKRCCVSDTNLLWAPVSYFKHVGYSAPSVYPITVYAAILFHQTPPAFYHWLASIAAPNASYAGLNLTDHAITTFGGPTLETSTAITPYAFSIFTGVFNGASSAIRHNKNAAVTGALSLPASNTDGYYVGANAAAGQGLRTSLYEMIVRAGADDTAMQDDYIDYLAARVGISV